MFDAIMFDVLIGLSGRPFLDGLIKNKIECKLTKGRMIVYSSCHFHSSHLFWDPQLHNHINSKKTFKNEELQHLLVL